MVPVVTICGGSAHCTMLPAMMESPSLAENTGSDSHSTHEGGTIQSQKFVAWLVVRMAGSVPGVLC